MFRMLSLPQVKTLLVIFCSFFILVSCFSVKRGKSRSAGKLYETFYVGQQGTQYFIKPLSFENSGNLELDFSFRHKDELKDSAIVNFSIFTNEVLKSIDKIVFEAKKISITSTDVGLLFNEKEKNVFESRFTTKISQKDLRELFRTTDWKITIQAENMTESFSADNSTRKKLSLLEENVFVLLD